MKTKILVDFQICISVPLNEVRDRGKVSKAINFALISNFQIAHHNLQILHMRMRLIAQAGKSHDKACLMKPIIMLR